MQRTFRALLALLLLFAVAPCPTLAQGGLQGLPEKRQLSDAERQQIKGFCDQHIPGLSQGPLEIKRSRETLLKYLIDPKVISGDFRREYALWLLPSLQQLVKDKSDLKAVNALQIAGELATQSIVDLLLGSLKDERVSVRFAAASAIGRMFDAVRLYEPAVVPAKLMDVVRELAQLVRTEKDPRVLDALVLAFESALKVPADQVNDATFRPSLSTATAKAIGARAKVLPDEPAADRVLAVLLRGVTAMRNAATQALLTPRGLPPQQRTDIRDMCSDVLTGVAALRAKGELSGNTARDAEQLETAAKSLRDLLAN
ncbi:MAG: HEAT repeat domain-containing protein [Phycisphaerales bacterium]